jgi:hypothetical protein
MDADVEVTYVHGDKGRIVTADRVVWAGYHAILPHICPDVAWWPEYWKHKHRPWIEASQRIGNIVLAGTEAAIEEAHRAVHSLGAGGAS